MTEKFDTFVKNLDTKPTWHNSELKTRMNEIKLSITSALSAQGKLNIMPKCATVDEIKKYDVIYMHTLHSQHYMIVYKVKNDIVYGLIVTSKDKHFCIHTIEKDRYFKGNFITTSYFSCPIVDAREKFVRVFESREEADEIFRKARSHYKELLNI